MTASIRIRPQMADDDERVVEIDNEIAPDLPPRTVEEYRHWIGSLPADAQLTKVVAEHGEKMVGRAIWNRFVYVTREGAYRLAIAVSPAEQGSGIGRTLYDTAVLALQALGARSVHASIREGDEHARAFVEHRGFRASSHGDRISRLEVRSAGLGRCRDAATRVRKAGLRIATLAEMGTDDTLLREIWAVETRASRDVPGDMDWAGLSYDQWRGLVLSGPGRSLDTVWIALDGTHPIGIATLQRRGPYAAENGFTGVDPGYRGRGVARALKLQATEWAGTHGIEFIYTSNDVQNAPMLAINVEMGYQPLPGYIEIGKEL